MSSVKDFQHRMARELVSAAHRKFEPARSSPTVGRLSALGLAVSAIALAVVGLNALRPEPISANRLEINQVDDRIEISVIDLVSDPEAIAGQLKAEANVDSQLTPVPVPPDLIGRIVTAYTSGQQNPNVIFTEEGAASKIVLEPGFSGVLFIEFGRQADEGETYLATSPDPLCGRLWGGTYAETIDELERYAEKIRFDTIDADQQMSISVAEADIDPTYGLTTVFFIDSETLLVHYAADPSGEPRTHPNCR